MKNRIIQTHKHHKYRRGAAAMIALVLIAVLGVITAVMLKDFHRNQMSRRKVEVRSQAGQLLADFKERTLTRLQADPAASEERIEIPPFSPRFEGTFILTFGSEGIQVQYINDLGKTLYVETQSLNLDRPDQTPTPFEQTNDHEN
jgi:hypothetical protein